MPDFVNALFDEMRQEAEAVVRAGAPDATLVETRAADMRYSGQGHEISVSLPLGRFDASLKPRLVKSYERDYAAAFGRTIPGLDVEIMNWTLRLRRDGRTAAALPACTGARSAKAAPDAPCVRRGRVGAPGCPDLLPRRSADRRRNAGSGRHHRDRNHDHGAHAAFWRASTRSARSCSRRNQHELQRSTLANPPAADVGPADLGRRGAGADAGAHRLLHLDARGRRPLRRCV